MKNSLNEIIDTPTFYFTANGISLVLQQMNKAKECFFRRNDVFILSEDDFIACLLCGLIREKNPFRLFDYCKRSGSCI